MILFIVDLITVISILTVTLKKNNLSFYHPLTSFLFVHVYVITFRLFQVVVLDLPTLGVYNESPSVWELSRAGLLADFGLLFIYLGYQLVEKNSLKFVKTSFREINRGVFITISFLCLVIGLYSMSKFLFIPVVDIGFVKEEKSMLFYANTWVMYFFVLLIFFYGFKKNFLIPLFLLFIVFGVQGEARFRIVLPAVMVVSLYLYRSNKRWPKVRYLIVSLLLLVVIFYPLKQVSRVLQSGGQLSDVINILDENLDNTASGGNNELMLLDMYASYLSAIDEHEVIYFGGTYMSIFYMFIPKSIWEDKPSLSQWMIDLSSERRDFGQFGHTPSIFGEAYANFRYFGVLVLPFLYSVFISSLYIRVIRLSRANHSSLLLFYLVQLVVLIQVMRDGLMALFLFSMINFFPIMLICILTFFFVGKKVEPPVNKSF